MKKKITEKNAKKWLKKNSWKIQKMRMGVGFEKGSCFYKQMILCQKVVNAVNKEMVKC